MKALSLLMLAMLLQGCVFSYSTSFSVCFPFTDCDEKVETQKE